MHTTEKNRFDNQKNHLTFSIKNNFSKEKILLLCASMALLTEARASPVQTVLLRSD